MLARAPHLPAELAATLDQLAIDVTLPEAASPDETGQMAQQRRLAGTGRAQQGDHFAVGHLQTDIVQRLGAGMEICSGPARRWRNSSRPLDVFVDVGILFWGMTAR